MLLQLAKLPRHAADLWKVVRAGGPSAVGLVRVGEPRGEIFGKDSFFKDQDPRAQFTVGRRMYLLRDGNDQLFPNDSSDVAVGVEPGPARDQLLDYLLNEFERDPTTDDVVAFGFTKQNFFLRMARQPFDCEQS